MSHMRGYCGVGVFHGKSTVNIGTLWRSAHCFGADFIFTVGRRYTRQPSDVLVTPKSIPLFNFVDLDDLFDHLPLDCRLMGIEITPRAKPLPSVCHPLQACYLLGAEDHGLSDEAVERCHQIIEIPGASHCLNVATAGSIVLYDRAVKMNREARLEAVRETIVTKNHGRIKDLETA